jgi:hypothetical protein
MKGVTRRAEVIDGGPIPGEPATIAAIDGENADPSNVRVLDEGIRALTPWGELAAQVGGFPGFSLVQQSDLDRVAPGA